MDFSPKPKTNEPDVPATSSRMALKFFLELVQVVAISLAIIIPVRYFLVQPFYVKGASMEPNFFDHEYLVIDELSYRFHQPQRGDIVVFHYPNDPKNYFIKRVIGLPGDQVMVKDGYTYLNNVKLLEPYINDPGKVLPEAFLSEGTPVTVPDGEYFVMGDNRLHSSDSREWGFVTRQEIVGRAFFRYWPIPDIGLVPTAESELTAGAVKGAFTGK